MNGFASDKEDIYAFRFIQTGIQRYTVLKCTT
jgi:hypothetical protein